MDSDSFDYELELFLFCDEIHQENEEIERPTGAAVVNDYVLVRFATKKTLKFFVGLIKEELPDGDYVVKFLRIAKNSAFYWPEVHLSVHFALPRPKSIVDLFSDRRHFSRKSFGF